MTNELYIQIIKYVDGEMNPLDRAVFEDSIKQSEDLSQEVEVYKEIKALGQKWTQNISDFDAVITEEIKVEHKEVWDLIQETRDNWKSKLSGGNNPGNKYDWVDDLIEEALQSETVPENPPDSLRMAFLNYKKKKYRRAIDDFESVELGGIRGDEDENLTAFYRSFYKGLSYMAEDYNKQAIPALEEAITNSTDELSKSKAQWYLALAYFKTNNTAKAEELLNQVAENEQAGEYRQKALNLLNELKNKRM